MKNKYKGEILNRYSFVSQIREGPKSLRIAAEIITELNGNINRIHYDQHIDPNTAFFEVTCSEDEYEQIRKNLSDIAYLRTSIKSLPYLCFDVKLPHRSGALLEFLEQTGSERAMIGSIDFDDSGSIPDRVTVSMNLEDTERTEILLNKLKALYPIEILEYSETGDELDRTVFYVRFAHEIRQYLADDSDELLMEFIKDINHNVQELKKHGEDPDKVFENYLRCGEYLNSTSGSGFYADVQEIEIDRDVTLFCFQLPAGGSIFLFDTTDEIVMIDTGYGIYAEDARKMFAFYGLDIQNKLKYIITTHADADHCGAGGAYNVPAYMHPATLKIIECGNRAWGSKSENRVLERIYTTMIALFSRWNPPESKNIVLYPEGSEKKRSVFDIISVIEIGGIRFEVLAGRGGHQYGQLIIYSDEKGIIFTADTLMNFSSLSEERKRYNSIADFLITSVNVDSDLAKIERKAISEIADDYYKRTEERCIICGGHGAVSYPDENGRLKTYDKTEHYTHSV
ncbi:MBL fold metallo-hydrolase [Methanoplanus endosymbiosus]|uniref:MBL fold metallo-hydrolase n=1 Tax=Methanoplanus endosymbiosus TaxID=33865 RepID=A0A9E7PJX0_9EURY|nr:MBL fold metallo-hydrolase [Methanoplanus endosymbiosus]UUX91279.1 MBL fold metallo-hydrolase [Methanoplanus endosymbiosus]